MALCYMVQVATPVPVNKTVARPTCKIAGVACRVFLTSRKCSWTVLHRLFEHDCLVLEAKSSTGWMQSNPVSLPSSQRTSPDFFRLLV